MSGPAPQLAYSMHQGRTARDRSAPTWRGSRDFPLNEKRFHWQSQARTTRESTEGRRHLNPARSSVTPPLFVRERADERAGVTMAFRSVGPVEPDGAEPETGSSNRRATEIRDAAGGAGCWKGGGVT